jgi:hypothetical protein
MPNSGGWKGYTFHQLFCLTLNLLKIIKMKTLKNSAIAFSMLIAFTHVAKAQQAQTSPPTSLSSKTAVVKVHSTNAVAIKINDPASLRIGSFTFATRADYDKAAAVAKRKSPAILTAKELQDLNIVPAKSN